MVLDNRNAVIPLSWKDVNLVEPLVDRFDFIGDELVRGISSFYWVMDIVLREVKRATDPQVTSILSKVRLGICDKGGIGCAPH